MSPMPSPAFIEQVAQELKESDGGIDEDEIFKKPLEALQSGMLEEAEKHLSEATHMVHGKQGEQKQVDLNAKDSLFEAQLKEALQEGDFKVTKALGQRFQRSFRPGSEQHAQFKAMKSLEDKTRFRMAWVQSQFDELQKKKVWERSYKTIDSQKGEYVPFAVLVAREGGDRSAEVAALRYATKCAKMQGRWVSFNPHRAVGVPTCHEAVRRAPPRSGAAIHRGAHVPPYIDPDSSRHFHGGDGGRRHRCNAASDAERDRARRTPGIASGRRPLEGGDGLGEVPTLKRQGEANEEEYRPRAGFDGCKQNQERVPLGARKELRVFARDRLGRCGMVMGEERRQPRASPEDARRATRSSGQRRASSRHSYRHEGVEAEARSRRTSGTTAEVQRSDAGKSSRFGQRVAPPHGDACGAVSRGGGLSLGGGGGR